MSIHCANHSNKIAFLVCSQCGFLCEEHFQEEHNKGHQPEVINETIGSQLYATLEEEQKQNTLLTAITLLKESVSSAIEIEERKLLTLKSKNAKIIKSLLSSPKSKSILVMAHHIKLDLQKKANNQSVLSPLVSKLSSILTSFERKEIKPTKSTNKTALINQFSQVKQLSPPKKGKVYEYYQRYITNPEIGITIFIEKLLCCKCYELKFKNLSNNDAYAIAKAIAEDKDNLKSCLG